MFSAFRPYGECFVFGGFHDFALSRSFVVDAAEVQNAVDDDAVQFFVIGFAEGFGVGAHGVEADKEVAAHDVVCAIVKRDDVGVVVVVEILAVHFQYLFVIAKDIGHFAHFFAITCSYGFNPGRVGAAFDSRHFHVDGLIRNHANVSKSEGWPRLPLVMSLPRCL